MLVRSGMGQVPFSIGADVAAYRAGSEALAQQAAVQAGMFPGWCSWMPFADFFDACKVPTAAQLSAQQAADLAKVAAVNPDLAAQGTAAGDAAAAAYCRQNPEACAEFTFAGENPTAAAILGAGPAARAVYSAPDVISQYGNWILLGVLGIGAVMLAKAVR